MTVVLETVALGYSVAYLKKFPAGWRGQFTAPRKLILYWIWDHPYFIPASSLSTWI